MYRRILTVHSGIHGDYALNMLSIRQNFTVAFIIFWLCNLHPGMKTLLSVFTYIYTWSVCCFATSAEHVIAKNSGSLHCVTISNCKIMYVTMIYEADMKFPFYVDR